MPALFKFVIPGGGGCAGARVNIWGRVYYWGIAREVETYEVPPVMKSLILDNGHSAGPGSDVGIKPGLPGCTV
jgi:hypothetical protein